jgi:SAM-dependent methyltransferase
MIRTTHVSNKHRGITFKEQELAHELLDGLQGIELGAAAHNPFGLDSINIAPADDFVFYREAQVEMCGAYAEIDIDAEAHDLPLSDDSQDYVISSHVLEHLPDPISAFSEWNRVVRDGGYVFIIAPLPGAHPPDKGRQIADLTALAAAQGMTVDSWDYEASPVPGDRRGHYFVYSPDNLIGIFDGLKEMEVINWSLVADEAVDTKVGNGFTLVYKVHKPEKVIEEQSVEGGEPEGEVPVMKKPRRRKQEAV